MNQTILIVDDEAHLRMLLQQTLEELEDEGVELLTATNGEEAIASGVQLPPSVATQGATNDRVVGLEQGLPASVAHLPRRSRSSRRCP